MGEVASPAIGGSIPMSDLDLPLPSAEQIRRREFATIRRGYDTDQVRAYLVAIATQVETMETDLRALRLKGAKAISAQLGAETTNTQEPAGPSPDLYPKLGKRLAVLIAEADAEARKIREDAETAAAKVLDEARAETDRLKVYARSRAEEVSRVGKEDWEKANLDAQQTRQRSPPVERTWSRSFSRYSRSCSLSPRTWRSRGSFRSIHLTKRNLARRPRPQAQK